MEEDTTEPRTTLEFYLQHSPDREKVEKTIQNLVEMGSISTQSPELAQLGAIAYINEIVKGVEAVAEHLPATIADMWQYEQKLREEDRIKLLDDLKKAQKISAIGRSASATAEQPNQLKYLWACGGAFASAALTAFVCNFVFFPAQVRSAMGNNSIALEWLGSPEGEIIRKAIKNDGLSLKSCVQAAAKKNIKPDDKRSIPCLISIKK
jgi:hypothetical protein